MLDGEDHQSVEEILSSLEDKRAEMEKEMRDRMEDERRMRAVKDQQSQMRGFLARQMEEKKHREHMEKALNDE